MALQPSLSPLLIVGTLQSPHTLEFYWDYICPFSRKSANAVENVIKPLLESKYPGKVKIIFRPQPQPWHASSTLVHEAGLAVAKVAPHAYWKYSLALFKEQEDFYDIPTSTLTAVQIRDKLADLGRSSGTLTSEEIAAVKDALAHKSTPNGGTSVTDNLKACIKIARQNSIHASPTVLYDGLVAPEVSSSWGEGEWNEFFQKRVTA